MFPDVSRMCIQLPAAEVDQFVRASDLPVNATQRFQDQVVAAHFVQDHHVEGGGCGSLFVVAADMEPFRAGSSMQELVQGRA